jgi:hypothetical protein
VFIENEFPRKLAAEATTASLVRRQATFAELASCHLVP